MIIALTATAFEEDRERILLEGCNDYVRKPFRKGEICDMLTKHLGVHFVYKEEPLPVVSEGTGDLVPFIEALSPETLSTFPSDWLEELRQATIRADLNHILDLIDQIRERAPILADALADMAEKYEYKKILSLIEGAGGQK